MCTYTRVCSISTHAAAASQTCLSTISDWVSIIHAECITGVIPTKPQSSQALIYDVF